MKTETPADTIIEISGLSRQFGSRLALDNISLAVTRGVVFGLVGENGAGKTTLIKHVLGLLKAQRGAVQVFGRDPVDDPVGVLGRIGYLSEQRELPPWMRVDELLRYTRAFYPKWDTAYAERLREQFAIDPAARIKHLSRGECAKAGLLIALAHRPDLLLLDEPSSGLDPVVRRDILEAVLRTVVEEGRTVFFSSHLLDEIERVSDHVAMIVRGRVALSGPLDAIKDQHHRLTLRFNAALSTPPALSGALTVQGGDREWTVICNGALAELTVAAEKLGARVVDQAVPSLDEIFVARAANERRKKE